MESVHLILIAVALVVLVAILASLRKPHRPSLPYTRRPSLLTAGEMRFYAVLVRAVPPGLVICPKVRLMDVVSVPDESWRVFGAAGSGMHLDFVLASADTLEPRLVIELDDRSHQWVEARRRDSFKDQALAAAGVPLLRVWVVARYDLADLAAKIKTALI